MTDSINTNIVSQVFTEGQSKLTGKSFRKWNIKDSEGSEYSRIVNDDFESAFVVGDAVEILYNKNGIYKNIVDVVKKEAPSSAKKQVVNTTKVINTPVPIEQHKSASNGMRNGMITGRAVELAIARGEINFEGLQQAALDVKALADFVENQS